MSSWAQVHHSSEIRAQSLATNLLPKGMLGESSNYFSRKIQVGEILYMCIDLHMERQKIYLDLLILIAFDYGLQTNDEEENMKYTIKNRCFSAGVSDFQRLHPRRFPSWTCPARTQYAVLAQIDYTRCFLKRSGDGNPWCGDQGKVKLRCFFSVFPGVPAKKIYVLFVRSVYHAILCNNKIILPATRYYAACQAIPDAGTNV